MKNTAHPLLEAYQLGDLKLKNRVVMASLTRGRATNIGMVPSPLMAEYYAQRASAGQSRVADCHSAEQRSRFHSARPL